MVVLFGPLVDCIVNCPSKDYEWSIVMNGSDDSQRYLRMQELIKKYEKHQRDVKDG